MLLWWWLLLFLLLVLLLLLPVVPHSSRSWHYTLTLLQIQSLNEHYSDIP